jgi:hypothetical protein
MRRLCRRDRLSKRGQIDVPELFRLGWQRMRDANQMNERVLASQLIPVSRCVEGISDYGSATGWYFADGRGASQTIDLVSLAQ